MVVSEIALALLIFIGIMAITALVFGGYVVVSALRGIGNALFGEPKPPHGQARTAAVPPPPTQSATPPHSFPTQTISPPLPMKGISIVGSGTPCQGPGCRQINPGEARFCRRCGHPISQVTAAAQRRVAMW